MSTGRTSTGGNLGAARTRTAQTQSPLTLPAEERCGPGQTRWAGARNRQGPPRPARRSRKAATAAARFEHAHALPRTQARMRLSSRPKTSGKLTRPPSVHFRPVRGNCGCGRGRSDTRALEAENVRGTVWPVCHFVNVS